MNLTGGPDAPDPAAMPPSPGASWWNVANGLTISRLLLVPVVIVLTITGGGPGAHGVHHVGWRLAAAGCFVLASLTDRVDGELARRRNLVTSFGKLADPIADKALTGAVLITLSVLGEIPGWVTAVVVLREAAVTVLRFSVLRHGVMAASRGGKVKTFLQGIALFSYLLPIGGGPGDVVRAVLLALAVLVTVLTGLDYLGRAAVLRRTSARALARRPAQTTAPGREQPGLEPSAGPRPPR